MFHTSKLETNKPQEHISIRFQQIDLPVGFRYYFKKVKSTNPKFSFSTGLGVQYKRIGAEFRYTYNHEIIADFIT